MRDHEKAGVSSKFLCRVCVRAHDSVNSLHYACQRGSSSIKHNMHIYEGVRRSVLLELPQHLFPLVALYTPSRVKGESAFFIDGGTRTCSEKSR